MADRVYTNEDFQKYINAMNNAADATDNINNFMNIQAFAEEDLHAKQEMLEASYKNDSSRS